MSEIQFTTVDRIFSKFHRDLRGTDLNESDVIEWIGEALDFLKVTQVQEQAIAFMEVKNFEATLPKGFHMVLQVARDNHFKKEEYSPMFIAHQLVTNDEPDENDCGCCTSPVFSDVNGFIIKDGDIIDYAPYFDMKFNYQFWLGSNFYRSQYTPIRLANHTLFNSIVCKERVDTCIGCTDEYTIVGLAEKKMRFSFQEGYVALSYLRSATDESSGYPLVPDHVSFITAITYYIKWKIAEWLAWNGREGFEQKAQQAEQHWIKYARQAKNYAKMPKSLDDYQDLLEQTHYLIPNHKKYYGFFGNLGRSQDLVFNRNTE